MGDEEVADGTGCGWEIAAQVEDNGVGGGGATALEVGDFFGVGCGPRPGLKSWVGGPLL